MPQEKLKILLLMKPFGIYPKHQPKVDMMNALEQFADVYYWYENGHIQDILQALQIKPDFIFHYDIAWNYGLAPKIDGLADIKIPKGCYVIDLHWKPHERIRYFEDNRIDLIFSATKNPFLNVFPQYKDKFRWLPWGINPTIMKDWKQNKDIDHLLMGLVHVTEQTRGKYPLPKNIPPKGRYHYRDTVFETLKNQPNFVFHPHPGHRTAASELLIVNENYAKELNRAKMFFTCGGNGKSGGVAVLKFFETPACRTLLLAEPNQDIFDLGFVDGENFIACNVDNFYEKALFYLKNETERKRITDNGYNFIHQTHTNEHRAKQIILDIKEIL